MTTAKTEQKEIREFLSKTIDRILEEAKADKAKKLQQIAEMKKQKELEIQKVEEFKQTLVETLNNKDWEKLTLKESKELADTLIKKMTSFIN